MKNSLSFLALLAIGATVLSAPLKEQVPLRQAHALALDAIGTDTNTHDTGRETLPGLEPKTLPRPKSSATNAAASASASPSPTPTGGARSTGDDADDGDGDGATPKDNVGRRGTAQQARLGEAEQPCFCAGGSMCCETGASVDCSYGVCGVW